MLRKSIIAASVFVLAVLAWAGIAGAQTCPNGETITFGTIVSGSYLNLCQEDGTTEVLREGLVNGKSKLKIVYTIPNVPAGTQSINFWGTRPPNPEGDNFQFYFNTDGGPRFQLIQNAVISKPFAPIGGLTVPLGLTTTSPTTIYLLLQDTNPSSGSQLDTVTLDTVRITTQ
jgi:hypothetical protein